MRVGDVDVPFTIMSVAKPFVLALVLETCGPEAIRSQIGVNATGYAFNAATPIELQRCPSHQSDGERWGDCHHRSGSRR